MIPNRRVELHVATANTMHMHISMTAAVDTLLTYIGQARLIINLQ